MPTERFRFQSNYFTKFETSGSIGYSSSDYTLNDLVEVLNGFTSRSAVRGTSAGGPIKTKRVSVNADWSGVYAVNDKFRILDFFRYDNWRIPGQWDAVETNLFGTPSPAPGVVGLLLAPGTFNSTNCPAAPFNQANCPQHTASSAADLTNEINTQFLSPKTAWQHIRVGIRLQSAVWCAHRLSLQPSSHLQHGRHVRCRRIHFSQAALPAMPATIFWPRAAIAP